MKLFKKIVNLDIYSIKILFPVIFIMCMVNFSAGQSVPCGSECKSLAFYTCTICYQACDNYSETDNKTIKTFNFQSC